jgi:methylmalonyl-CoA mutase N-terminal domain/subunit
VSLQAQQPLVNVARVSLQAMAAVLGGTQSLHTNSYDEALGLPTQQAAQLALRTQQVIGYESGVADFVDPLAGSYAVESLTNEIEARALDYIARIEEMGGVIPAIEAGYIQREIERRAYEHQRAVETNQRIVVGVNEFTVAADEPIEVLAIDPQLERAQSERVRAVRAKRDQAATDAALTALGDAARGGDNTLPKILAAVKALATVGEIADALRNVFGEYRPAR